VDKYERIKKEIEHLNSIMIYPGSETGRRLNSILVKNNSSPLRQPTLLSVILKRPEVNYDMIAPFDGELKDFGRKVIEQVEYEIKYEGFIEKQLKTVEKFRHIENIKIPGDIDYSIIPGLSLEIQQKLKRFSPLNLGQANRISGVTPAAISILMVYLKR